MSVRVCLTLFLVHSAFCENISKPIIDEILIQTVFGFSPSLVQHSVSSASSGVSGYAQAVAVTAQPPDIADNVTDTEIEEPQFIQSTASYDQFDLRLTKMVASSSDQNFLLSPLGLKLALAILTEAATGVTRSELSSVLGNDVNITVVRNKYSTILKSLHTQTSEYILNMGSRIYLEDGVRPQQKFAANAHEFYHTDLININFNDPAHAATEINAWVANVTAGKISALVDDEDIAGVVALVLTTLYYKGNWTHQFPLPGTKPGNFFVSPNKTESVEYMNTRNKFYYSDSAKYDAKILRLPYLGNKFSMYIIVPNSLTGLTHVMSTLTERNLRREIELLKERLVDVTLPKFRFDYTSVLDHVLQELGIRQAFQDTASFPGIARGSGLRHYMKISRVLQRSGIDVNEVGSIAYSATEITLVNKFGDDDEIYEEVMANKPFMFFIQDEATRQLLFTGRVTNPGLVDGALKLP